MTNGQMNMFGQLLTLQARVAYRQTRIASGVYKERIVKVGSHDSERQLTEDELLKDEIEIMEAHIRTMQEITDNFFNT